MKTFNSQLGLIGSSLILISSAFLQPIMNAAEIDSKPIVIAHRGASGYLPEHTLEAYSLAHAQGADYIEQDLVMTKDGRLICLHDIHLESTTNVELAFPQRKRADGHWYAIDFLLSEIQTLKVHERLPKRFPQHSMLFAIPTFHDAILLIQGLDQTTKRRTGIYPELKQPNFHRKEGKPLESTFVDELRRAGFDSADDLIFVQSFELDCLERLHREFRLPHPLIYLVGDSNRIAKTLTEEYIANLARTIQGIGPSKKLLDRSPNLVEIAHQHGLMVHPYTLRFDDSYPSKNYTSFEAELDHLFLEKGVDGVFTDFPDLVKKTIERGDRSATETPSEF